MCQCSTSWRICILLWETSTHFAEFQEVNINHIYWEVKFYSTMTEKKSTQYILNFTVSSLSYLRIPKQNMMEHFLTQLFNHTSIITMILWTFGFGPSIPSKFYYLIMPYCPHDAQRNRIPNFIICVAFQQLKHLNHCLRHNPWHSKERTYKWSNIPNHYTKKKKVFHWFSTVLTHKTPINNHHIMILKIFTVEILSTVMFLGTLMPLIYFHGNLIPIAPRKASW